MKFEAQWFVAGKLILKQALPAIAPDCNVFGRELRVAAMNFEISGFTVLPRPLLDGLDKKH